MSERAKPLGLLIPSLADALSISFFLYLAFTRGKGLLNDGDTGYHIRVGEFILEKFAIPRQDMFSHITPPLPWTAHEWLSEIIMALVHRAAGLTGVVLFFAGLISLTLYLFFRVIRSYRTNLLLTVAMTIMVASCSTIHWLARPHIFSLLLMVLWYAVLDGYQYQGRNRLLFLPLLMVFWVNLHGGYLTGFILLGIYLLGNLLHSWWGTEIERLGHRRRAGQLAIVTGVCLLAALVNPFGYHILIFPFTLLSNTYIMDHVSEFISPNFHEPLPFKYLLLFTIGLLALARQRLNLIETGLIIFFTNMALFAARYMPLFAFIVAPILLRKIQVVLDSSNHGPARFLQRRHEVIASVDILARGFIWPFAAVALVVAGVAEGRIHFAFDPEKKPVAAMEFLLREPITGNMFNNDEFGDYVIYAAASRYRPFIDGRLDMYGVPIFKEYYKVIQFEPGWEEILAKYGITWVFFNTDSPLARHLYSLDRWRLVYSDQVASIFVKNVAEHRHLLQNYPHVQLATPKNTTKQ